LNTYPALLTSSVNSTNAAITGATAGAANSTLIVIQNSTLTAYNQYVTNLNSQISTVGFSSLYAFQNLSLTGTTFLATMDMINYRNFTIRVYGLQTSPASNYRINYSSNGISGLDYRKGIITLDISTVGSFYANNNSQLRFDVYRWGLPTTVFGNVFPTVSNSDYILQYEYTILNQVIYTNLLNVYPRIAAKNSQISSITRNVGFGSGTIYNLPTSSNFFWRGTPVLVQWSNYSFFPFGTLGSPSFNPDILVDVVAGGNLIAQYGPYPLSISSATILAPYLSNQTSPLVPTTVFTYIAGNFVNATSTIFTTVIPQFTQVSLYSANYPGAATSYLGGTELVGVTDGGFYPLTNLLNVATSFPNDVVYSANNLIRGTLNTLGSNGAASKALILSTSLALGQFIEATLPSGNPDFYVNFANYFTYIPPIQSFGSQFTFTFSNAINSYSFLATSITQVSGTQYRLTNPLITRTGPTFTVQGQTCFMKYSYTLPTAVTSNSAYAPSTFLGPPFQSPATTGPPTTGTATYTGFNYPVANDAMSRLAFYNVTSNSPIGSLETALGLTSTASTLVVASFTQGGISYTSSFVTTGSATDFFQL